MPCLEMLLKPCGLSSKLPSSPSDSLINSKSRKKIQCRSTAHKHVPTAAHSHTLIQPTRHGCERKPRVPRLLPQTKPRDVQHVESAQEMRNSFACVAAALGTRGSSHRDWGTRETQHSPQLPQNHTGSSDPAAEGHVGEACPVFSMGQHCSSKHQLLLCECSLHGKQNSSGT